MTCSTTRRALKHYLSGRTDGQLKVVAGEAVAAGEQVFIVYGTETTSAAELLARYGFVAPGTAAADRQLVMAHADAIPALRATTAQDDAARLAADPPPPLEELALRFRVALKRATRASRPVCSRRACRGACSRNYTDEEMSRLRPHRLAHRYRAGARSLAGIGPA